MYLQLARGARAAGAPQTAFVFEALLGRLNSGRPFLGQGSGVCLDPILRFTCAVGCYI